LYRREGLLLAVRVPDGKAAFRRGDRKGVDLFRAADAQIEERRAEEQRRLKAAMEAMREGKGRLELEKPIIAGDKEINTEMAKVISGDIDYDEFIAKYGFNWFAVDRIDRIDMYLQYNENYENVYDDGVLKIYKAI
jgi:hypothetical protein